MKRYIIERDMPGIGDAGHEQIREAAQKSNEVLAQLGPEVQWIELFVTDDKIFCVYLAADTSIVRRHAQISGFPVNTITEIKQTIDPTTAAA